MKPFLFLFLVFIATGCSQSAEDAKLKPGRYPYGVSRFDDGPISCFVYFDKGISCVKQQ